MDDILSNDDREQIDRHGLSEGSVRRQLSLLRDPPPGIELVRPATVGDGVVRLEAQRHEELIELYDKAAAAGRFSKFVPASGAASRMFKSLLAVYRGQVSPSDEAACERWLTNLERFPFHDELKAAVDEGSARDRQALLAALLEDDGLAYARRPKGLVAFHHYRETRERRTPFEEHLFEAAEHVRDREGRCRLHFTILKPHEALFRAFWDQARPRHEARLGARFEVDFSFQDPSTDTVAADPEGGLFRGHDGRLVIRPGGHGALIRNVERFGGDLVFIKNVDNVVPDERRGVVVRWKKLLGGFLIDLERRLVDIVERRSEADARRFLENDLGLPGSAIGTSAEEVLARLSRPLRVCGVVANTGEPGGGPFWIQDHEDGESLQIVETSQIDTSRPDQAEILARSAYFNPVDLVCRLRDHRGKAFPLARYVDPMAVFVARKSHEGRPLLTLEHPGLWNGAMAHWNTVLVEVPGETFAPVKTVLDLLRPEHQCADRPAGEEA